VKTRKHIFTGDNPCPSWDSTLVLACQKKPHGRQTQILSIRHKIFYITFRSSKTFINITLVLKFNISRKLKITQFAALFWYWIKAILLFALHHISFKLRNNSACSNSLLVNSTNIPTTHHRPYECDVKCFHTAAFPCFHISDIGLNTGMMRALPWLYESTLFILFAKYYWGDQIKRIWMSVKCSMHGGNEEGTHNFNRINWRPRSVRPIMWKVKKHYIDSRRTGIS
jgi:hypothetical protein